MGAFKDFTERRKTGTYVSCSYSPITRSDLGAWCAESLIPQPLEPSKYHTTILYSRKEVLNAQELLSKLDSIQMTAKSFKLFDTKTDPSMAALVIELDAPELIKLHKRFIAAGGTHDYPDYTPHVTVTYYADPKMDLSHLKLPDFKFTATSFKAEPDIDWRYK